MINDKKLQREFEVLASAPLPNRDELPSDEELDRIFADDNEPRQIGEIMRGLAHGSLIDKKSNEVNLLAVINRRKEHHE